MSILDDLERISHSLSQSSEQGTPKLLLPCPFCGGEPEIDKHDSEYRQEIEQAAIMNVTCPSCNAKPGELCHYIGHGGGLCRIKKVPTHQRRLRTYVSSDLREIL